MEIKEGIVTVNEHLKIDALCFDTKSNLIRFYTRLEKDYCTHINRKDYYTYSFEFRAINKEWYGDTIYIFSEEGHCKPLKGEPYTSVFLTFKNKYGNSILQKSTETYKKIKTYFNDVYLETAK